MDSDINNFLDTIDKEESQAKISNTLANSNELAKLELLSFTRNLIKKAEAKNELKDRVVQILMERLSDPDQVADIPISVLSNLYEKLSRNDNDFIGHILNGMRSSASNVNVNVANGITPREEIKEVNPIKQNLIDSINKEDYQSIRNVLSFVNKIKDSGEFPEIEMNNKFNYVLIDGSNLYHRSYHLFKPNGKVIIENLLKTVDKISEDFCNDKSILYFIFDNSQSQINIRKEVDPLYKSNREKIDKEIYKYHNIFIELLKVKNDNYKILMAGSLEADDLVKPLINYLYKDEKDYCRTLLISNDMDWSRNINDKVYWYNWNSIINKEEFYSKYKFFPSEESIKIYKCVKGDSSDNITPGMRNFPMIELIKICNDAYNFKSFKDFLSYIETLNENVKQLIKSNLRNIKRNYSLVDFIDIKINIDEFIKNCKKIDIQYRLMLEGIGVEVPSKLKSKDDIVKDFFNI